VLAVRTDSTIVTRRLLGLFVIGAVDVVSIVIALAASSTFKSIWIILLLMAVSRFAYDFTKPDP
jgi:hypothetical protein